MGGGIGDVKTAFRDAISALAFSKLVSICAYDICSPMLAN